MSLTAQGLQAQIIDAAYRAGESLALAAGKRAADYGMSKYQQYKKRSRYGGGTAGARYFRVTRPRRMNRRTGGFTGMELKFVDSSNSQTLVKTPAGSEIDDGTMLCLNGIAQGDGENQRDGREVVVKSVTVKGQVALPAAADISVSGPVFIALVLDQQTNGAQFNAEDVYEQPLANQAVSVFRNLEYTGRFRVLATKRIDLNPSGGAGNGTTNNRVETSKAFSFYRKLNIPVRYTGTGATVANITDNSLHLMAIGQSTAIEIAWASRVRFIG